MRTVLFIALALLPLACSSDSLPARDLGTSDGTSLDGSRPGTDGSAAADASTPRDGSSPRDGGPIACDHSRVDTNSPPATASWRFGGGVGYPDRPPSVGECVTVVRNRAELEGALGGAAAGDVV